MISTILKLFGIKMPSSVYVTINPQIDNINDETAIMYGPFFRGIMTIASDVSSLPIAVYKRKDNDDREKITDHPVAKILSSRVNRYMTKQEFFELLQFHALLYGNGVAQIILNKQNEVIGLVPLMPWFLQFRLQNGDLVYVYEPPNAKQVILSPEEVIHIKGFTFDGVVGVPLYVVAKQSIQLGLSAEALSIAFYQNGATLSGIIKLPYSLNNEEQIRKLKQQWRDEYQGVKNSGKIPVLEEGADFKPISPSFEDSQWIEGRQFQKGEISHWFLMPPSKIGEKGTYSSLEESNRDYLTSCLNKWLVKIEEELTTKLFTQFEEKDYFIEFNRNALLRTALSDRYNAYTKAIHYGFMSPNEVRKLENLPAYEGGDRFYSPVNIWPNDEERPMGKNDVVKKTIAGSSGDGKEGSNELKEGV